MVSLPLFPLNIVLFPRMLIPLHVFEDRYKALIDYCSGHDRVFGIVLIREGLEVGGPATPHAIGTKAQILRVEELDEGRKHVIVRGTERFTTRRLHTEGPYLVADADEYPLEAGGFNQRLLAQTEMAFYRYLRLLKEAQGITVSISNLPDDPEGIAWMIGWGLQSNLVVKQQLLAVQTLQELLEQEYQFIEGEIRVLQVLAAEATKRRAPSEHLGHISFN
jgi:Lon protease-like protein